MSYAKATKALQPESDTVDVGKLIRSYFDSELIEFKDRDVDILEKILRKKHGDISNLAVEREKIIAAAREYAQKTILPCLDPRPFIQREYKRLQRMEFRDPTLEEQALIQKHGLPEEAKIPRSFPKQSYYQAYLDLSKRALSYMDAALIVLEQHYGKFKPARLKSDSEALFAEYREYMKKLAQRKQALTDPIAYQRFIDEELNAFIETLCRSLAQSCEISVSAATRDLMNAELLANWERDKYPVMTITESKDQSLRYVTVTSPVSRLTAEQKREYSEIKPDDQVEQPRWFKQLTPFEQTWLRKHMDAIIGGQLSAPPALYRKVPGCANLQRERRLALKGAALISDDTSYHYAVVPVIGVKNKAERERLTQQNVQQARELLAGTTAEPKDALTAFWGEDFATSLKTQGVRNFYVEQRLLSPLTFIDWFPHGDNNRQMLDESVAAFSDADKGGLRILQSNYAINSGRSLSTDPRRLEINRETRDTLIQYASAICKALIAENKITLDASFYGYDINYFFGLAFSSAQVGAVRMNPVNLITLADIIKSRCGTELGTVFTGNAEKANQFILSLYALAEYQRIWDNLHDNPHDQNLPLMLAAYESLIVKGLGGQTGGGCKSSKDRSSIKRMIERAMERFYFEKQRLPDYKNEDDVNVLAGIFADVYLSGHYQALADQFNSYGCHGIQDGKGFAKFLETVGLELSPMLPRQFIDAIGRAVLARENKIGHYAKPRVKPSSGMWGFIKKLFSDIGALFKRPDVAIPEDTETRETVYDLVSFPDDMQAAVDHDEAERKRLASRVAVAVAVAPAAVVTPGAAEDFREATNKGLAMFLPASVTDCAEPAANSTPTPPAAASSAKGFSLPAMRRPMEA